jgi:hypothetical protein
MTACIKPLEPKVDDVFEGSFDSKYEIGIDIGSFRDSSVLSMVFMGEEAPESPFAGQTYINSKNGSLNCYDGTRWLSISLGCD